MKKYRVNINFEQEITADSEKQALELFFDTNDALDNFVVVDEIKQCQITGCDNLQVGRSAWCEKNLKQKEDQMGL